MQISVGDTLPSASFLRVGADGPEEVALKDLTTGKKTVIFGLPGAYTRTCSASHMPSFVDNIDKLREAGVAEVICISVNDPFVMAAWGKDTGAEAAGIHMLGDPRATFTKEIGMAFTAEPVGLIDRSRRYAMIVYDNVVQTLSIEDSTGQCSISSGDAILDAL